jgi:hypothetical protein
LAHVGFVDKAARPRYGIGLPRAAKKRKADGEGFEAITQNDNPAKHLRHLPIQGEAESEAVYADSDLKLVIDTWLALPVAIKAGILAMVRSGP